MQVGGMSRSSGWVRIALVMPLLAAACTVSLPSSPGSRSAPADTGKQIAFGRAGWLTDFSKHSVPLSEIESGGPPRDGIPPIDHPKFESVGVARTWLRSREPVIALTINGDHRAYPLEVLIWHEIVNDQVGGIPVTVTFCPLCDTAIAFDRRAAGRVLDFGTTGNLRKSDLVMWDRQTQSWWQQATGTAIVGTLTGTVLSVLPAQIVGFVDYFKAFPGGQVLSRDTGFDRPYGDNPYVGYDNVNQRPFLYSGPIDGRLPPKERVVTVSIGGQDVAYPYSIMERRLVAMDTLAGVPIAIFFDRYAASALDGPSIAESRDGGASGVFRADLNGRTLSFHPAGGMFVDDQTGSTWDLLGLAVAGPLAGSQLQPVVHGDHFWFAWAAFKPKTRIYLP
jgi:uncharacterized protein DUF3179